MKIIVIISVWLLSQSIYAEGIYKCQSENGKVVFSGKPCAAKNANQEVIKPAKKNEEVAVSNVEAKIANSKATTIAENISPVEINNQEDFLSYIKNLKFNTLSAMLKGVSKNSFHGISVLDLFSKNKIEYEDWFTLSEKLEFLVSINDESDIFSVRQEARVDGRGAHPFLDLDTSSVLSIMTMKGFGKPVEFDDEYHWQWDLEGAKCEVIYTRSPYNQAKSLQYSCHSR